MDDQLEERVAALERAVTDGEGDAAALAEAAVTAERLEALETTVEDLEDRVAELEAATQALRGYVGNVRSVNREVEERADLALSRVEALTGEPTGDGRPASEDGNTHGRRQDRGSGPGDGDEGGGSGDRCDRCGRPRERGTATGRSERELPGSAGARDGPDSTRAGEDTAGTVGAPVGGERTSPGSGAPSWKENSVPEPARDGVGVSDGSDAEGPIGRLRQLL
ncbi:MAG: hypothetical protein V5A30_02360 [Haloarculaceae archaeon]